MPSLQKIEGQFVYEPDGAVLDEFIRDRSEVAVIVGPIGSGSSTASCFKIWFTACEQHVAERDGKRHSRWAIVRTTYPELNTSTLKTWLTWFPEEQYGTLIKARPMHQTIQVGDLDLEVWFLALDDIDDIKKLRSTEFTGIWFNELEYHTYEMFSEAHSRVAQGRYPPMMDGGPKWHGIIGDMNAPDEEHFVSRMAGWSPWPDDTPEDKRLTWPQEWWLKKQPPGLIEVFGPDGKTVTSYVENPSAENKKWLKGSYLDVARGKTKQWIDSRIMNRISFLANGDPVWPGAQARLDLLLWPTTLDYVPGRELLVSLDFGRRPTALISQEIGEKIHDIEEYRMYNAGAATFAPALKRHLEQNYRGATIRFTGDPKGRDKPQTDERSAYDIFESYGMKITPAPFKNNVLSERLEIVASAIERHRFVVSTKCPTLRAALSGKYVWKKDVSTGEALPLKDKYSDIADCKQYQLGFLGEGRKMLGLETVPPPVPRKIGVMRRTMRRVS